MSSHVYEVAKELNPGGAICTGIMKRTTKVFSDDVVPPMCAAAIPDSAKWPLDQFPLKIEFLHGIPDGWVFQGRQMTISDIIDWAKAWKLPVKRGCDKPLFKKCEEGESSNIRVSFYERGEYGNVVNNSYLGAYAMSYMQSPTLWLNLSTGGDDVKIYLVRHEFGHALGLLHEHQRPDLWQNIREFMDLEKMDRELGPDAERNVGEEKYWSFDNSTKYDPESIMHYPLAPFVKDEYRMCDAKQLKQKIKNKEKYKYMIKILKIDNPAIEPSKLDLKCLTNVYTMQEYGTRGPFTIPITLAYKSTGVNNYIYVVGSFNNWNTEDRVRMNANSNGVYTAVVNFYPGVHEFKFIVDGKWVHDENEPARLNCFGTYNNVIYVTQKHVDAYWTISGCENIVTMTQGGQHQNGTSCHPVHMSFF